jgi:integrase
VNTDLSVYFVRRNDLAEVRLREPYIVEEPTMRIVEAPSIFLREYYVESQSRSSEETWRSAAYDVRYWLEFLQVINIDWNIATLDDLKKWRDFMTRAISPHTGEKYAPNTIRPRLLTVLSLYRLAKAQGWYDGDLAQGARRRKIVVDKGKILRSPSKGSLQDERGQEWSVDSGDDLEDLVPRSKRKREAMRPFSVHEWRKFEAHLGPLPRERGPNDQRSSRNRLIAETALWGALRVAETKNLEIHPSLAMTPDPRTPHAHQRLWIKEGKGGKSGWITLPNYLVEEIILFIQGEREDLLKDLGIPRNRRPKALFLSNRGSNNPGRPLTSRRYQQIITETCLRAGLCTAREKVNPEEETTFLKNSHNHTFHDLRHTYATWTYWAEVNRGNPEPWLKIKTQLRHEHLQTTIDTYIHEVEIFKGITVPMNIRGMLGLGK